MAKDDFQLQLDPNTFDVLRLNPGVTFSPNQLTAIQRGTVVVKQGCIERLLYHADTDKLRSIELDHSGWVTPSNATTFQELFEKAACCGFRLLFCFNQESREITMLHLFPCRCKCDEQH